MQRTEPTSIEEYESFLTTAIAPWEANRRVALAAAMAERWFHVYEKFAATEQWGDPVGLGRILGSIWDHACGRPLSSPDRGRYARQIDEFTPHMDDFDAYEALALCVILKDALDACGQAENAKFVVRAALSGFEAALPDWAMEPEDQPRLWQRVAVRRELTKQLQLLDRISHLTTISPETVASLRPLLTTNAMSGEYSRPIQIDPPPGMTNQDAFEQYRRLLTSQLNRPAWVPPTPTPYMLAMSIFTAWGVRYTQRLRALSGKGGRLADAIAVNLLIARNRLRDASNLTIPDWDPEMREVLAMCLANPACDYDVKHLDQPHGYGPSIRQLWYAAKQRGLTDAAAWESVAAWSCHRPVAWAAEDQRKKRGQAHASTVLADQLHRELNWQSTGDSESPWTVESDGLTLRIRLNDFPDDVMYSLLIDGVEIGTFPDWPGVWTRS